VYLSHRRPKNVVCDRDSVIFFKFEEALTNIFKVKIRASSAHHPQTDGQAEMMNRKVEEMIRNFANHNQSDWDFYLVAVEVARNRSPNAVTACSPFSLVTCYRTPIEAPESRFPSTSVLSRHREHQ